jgi:uncharacterized membrane protein YqjE
LAAANQASGTRESANSIGIFASLRRLLDTTLEIAQVRLDLLGSEVELEKRRLFSGLVWGAVAFLFWGVGLILLCGFVILLFWDGYRLAAVGVTALLFLVGGVIVMREAQQRLRSPRGMFSASLAEIDRDRSGLGISSQNDHG